jgi:Tfp pilus assembly pilus retraction ATPase PilT
MDRPIHLEGMHGEGEASERVAAFAYAMRNSLRRNPETIVIGETTDPETVALAIQLGAEAARKEEGN